MKMSGESEYLTSLTKFYTLALLSQKPRHGYEIITEVEDRIGKKPSTGQIYPLLEELEEEGVVESEKREVNGRKRKVYNLTSKGEKVFSKTSRKFYNLVHEILSPWLTECAYCECKIFEGHQKDEKTKGGYREKIGGESMTFCCKHCAQAYKETRNK